MASASSAARPNIVPPMTNKTYIFVLIDGNTLRFNHDDNDGPYGAGCRAADALRYLVKERLTSTGVETSQNLEVHTQIYADGEGLIPPKLDDKDLDIAKSRFKNFLRGFNTRQPLLVFEDTSVTGPSSAGDALLRRLKDRNCFKVIIAKPYGAGFRALLQAQRRNGTLPAKLTEMMVHPQAFRSPLRPYPFISIPSDPALENPGPTMPLQDLSTETAPVQSTPIQSAPTQAISTKISAGHSNAVRSNSIQNNPVPNTPNPNNHVLEPILRNSSGQRVDPRVDALGWLVKDARPRNICFEFHLHGRCTWAPKPCPRGHTTTVLNLHQLNALQVLAKEVPCDRGNTCPDWRCCFGHRCPFGEKCTKGTKRSLISRDLCDVQRWLETSHERRCQSSKIPV